MINPDKPETHKTQGYERATKPADVTAAYQPGVAGEELVRVLDQYLADLEAGRAPSREKLLAEHPALASQLEPCLSGIEFIHRAARPATDAPSRLGDFEIMRKVGEGGMGVVYEAQQLSLKRKVALKVLRFAGVADQDAMERFQREAETVAQLHHTNIVPIFAIGEQQGVFYYAMQFIEGRSLAAVLEQSQNEAKPLDLVEAARWTLQAAEALAHAHQRNVIHRDVKPSNLILDPAGQVWLTDFGLAKRMDDMALSMTGALLGTPRYMSPEQASAAKQPVDQRTDIYSLGATLYELATGKPLFEADSAHAIISQILTTEPPPPRKVRTGLPRDLETIILKCLAKEPQSRYATAQALVDDLRAFCEGRAIKARRAGLAERTIRWVRKNRRLVSVAAGAAAVAVLLVVGGIMISSQRYQSLLGHISLKTEGPSLVAEVLEADQDRPVVPSFTVPTTEPVALPAGSYRLRLSAPGRAAETSRLLVDSGSQLEYQIGLKQQLLWDPISLNQCDTARLVNLKPEGWNVIRSDWRTLRLLQGFSARSLWEWSLAGDIAGRSLAYSDRQYPPELVQPAPDLDGDGVGDLVWACRSSAALWAISGAANVGNKGRELWWFSAGPGETLGVPAVADVDGDGTVDFIATFANGENVWIEAVSGKTGKSLWKAPIEGQWFQNAEHSRWAPEVVQLDGHPVVVCVAGSRLLGLDLKSGKPLWPAVDVGMKSIIRPHLADLGHVGQPDPLLVGLEPNGTLAVLAFSLATRKPLWKKALLSEEPSYLSTGWPNPELEALRAWPWVVVLDGSRTREVIVPIIPAIGRNHGHHWGGIEVLDGATGESRWQRRLRLDDQVLCCDRLLVGPDIDGDGLRDLFVATTALYDGRQAVFVDALSGKDGHSLWWWRSDKAPSVYSSGGGGSGGNGFSANRFPAPFFRVTSLRLWSTGRDGWPQLVVPYTSGETAVLSAGTGRLQQKISAHDLVQAADVDADGIDDLVLRAHGQINQEDKLCAIRGTLPEMWRRLGDWQPADDFDGDGIPDLISGPASGSLSGTTVISGRDGHVLSRSAEPPRKYVALPPGHNDLDGDGTPDFLVVGGERGQSGFAVKSDGVRFSIDLHAISGRTGKRIWSAEEVLVPTEKGQTTAMLGWNPCLVTCHDLQGDGDWKVLVLYEMISGNNPTHQLWLAVLSARDGKAAWRQLLAETNSNSQFFCDMTYQPTFADLDGDGVLDLVVALPVAPEKSAPGMWGSELFAISGRDGKLLWRRPLTAKAENYNLKNAVSPPAVGRLGGNGNLQVVVLTQGWQKQDGTNAIVAEVQSFDARTAEPTWTYRPRFQNTNFLRPQVDLVDLDGEGKLAAYVSVHSPIYFSSLSATRIAHPGDGVVVDSRGHLLPAPEMPIAATYDLNGDGKQGLLLLGDLKGTSTLRVTQGGTKKIMWERSNVQGIVEILRGKAGQPATVVVMSGNNSTLGLDGATGQPLWRCPYCRPFRSDDSLLMPPDPREPPWLISHDDGSTVCRRALATTPDGEYAPAVGSPLADLPLPDDPRIVRPLPWLWQTSLAADAPSGVFPRLIIGGSLFLLMLVVCVARRRWWSLTTWLAVFLAVTVAATYLFLRDDAQNMDPMEHYAWSGWYQVLYFGMSITGVIVVQWLIIWLVWQFVRRAVGRILARTRAA